MKKVLNKKNMRIAIVSDAIYPYNKGGKEKRIYEISTRLAKQGHDVHIYCMKWWKTKNDHRVENGVHLHAISKLYPLYSGHRRSIRQAVFFALACFKLLKEKFDLVEVDHMPHLVLFPIKIVTLLKRKTFYATWNEVWGREYWKKYLGTLGTLAYFVEWLSARMPEKIIAISDHTKEKLISDLKIKQKIYVINNGIDIQTIAKVKPAKEKSDIIFAGRLLSHKNVDLLIKSIIPVKRLYPHIKVLIIGDGPEKNKLKNLIKNLKLTTNIKMFDFLENHNDLYSFMKSSKVFVFPSSREGFGIVALEANASGIPVITINHKDNATKDLIQNGSNGYVVDSNVDELAKYIKTCVSIKNSRTKYTTFAENYDWNNVAKKIEEVYLQ